LSAPLPEKTNLNGSFFLSFALHNGLATMRYIVGKLCLQPAFHADDAAQNK